MTKSWAKFPSIYLLLFLKRDVNKAFARVTGSKINRDGLEIPWACVYEFYGPKPYIDKLREVITSLHLDLYDCHYEFLSPLPPQVCKHACGVSGGIFNRYLKLCPL